MTPPTTLPAIVPALEVEDTAASAGDGEEDCADVVVLVCTGVVVAVGSGEAVEDVVSAPERLVGVLVSEELPWMVVMVVVAAVSDVGDTDPEMVQ